MPQYFDFRWRVESQLHAAIFRFADVDDNIIANVDSLSLFSGKYEHYSHPF